MPTRLRRTAALRLLAAVVGVIVAHGVVAQEARRAYIGPDGAILPFADDAQVLEFLRTADIEDRESIGSGTTEPVRVYLNDGSLRARAIFRNVSERRQNIQLRDGDAFAGFYDDAIFECAAYELATMLGVYMVPPAVDRHLDGERGTLQLWIEDAMTEGDRSQRGLSPPDVARWRRQQAVMRVFDALIHNSDRNSGNSIIDPQWNLWLIDHTRSFQRPRGRPDFSGVNQIPSFLWGSLKNLDFDEVRRRLNPWVDLAQLRSLSNRHQALVEHIRTIIVERGEEAVVIP